MSCALVPPAFSCGKQLSAGDGLGGIAPVGGTGQSLRAMPSVAVSVSAAAQWHEAVHERIPWPHTGRQLQFGGQWRCAAPCGQPGPPAVQSHWLAEEETRTLQGQPARESQQVMAPAPETSTQHPWP